MSDPFPYGTLPPLVLRLAAEITKEMRQLMNTSPEVAWEGFQGAWATILNYLVELSQKNPGQLITAEQATAMLVIQEYFTARGNLDEMLRSIRAHQQAPA